MRKFGVLLLLALFVSVGCEKKKESEPATPAEGDGDTSAVTQQDNTQLVMLNLPGMT